MNRNSYTLSILLVFIAWHVQAAFNVDSGYTARQLHTSQGSFTTIGGLALEGDTLYFGQYTEVKSVHLDTLSVTNVGTLPANAGISWVARNSNVTYTAYGESYSSPYPYKLGLFLPGGTYTNLLDLDGIYDGAVNAAGELYVVANPDAAGSRVFRLNWSTGATEIANIGGYSGGLAFDAAGNLYVASQVGAGAILKYTPAQLSTGGLTSDDAQVVLNIKAGYLAFDAGGFLYATTGWGAQLGKYDLNCGLLVDVVATGGIGKIVTCGYDLFVVDTDWIAYASTVQHITPHENWSQFHGDSQHIGRRRGSFSTNDVVLRWSAGSGLLRASQPAVSADGRLVFAYGDSTNQTGLITAFDGLTGQQCWTARVRSHVNYTSWSSPISHEGYVYWAGGSGTGTVYKINATNGNCDAASGGWATNVLEGSVVNATPTIAGDLLYISDYGGFTPENGSHYALSLADGHVVWRHDDGGQGQGAMAYDPDRALVYQTVYTNGAHWLVAYDATNGVRNWTAAWNFTNSPFQCAMSYESNSIYIQDYSFGGDGVLYAVNATNAAIAWTAATPSSGNSCPAVDDAGDVYVFGDYAGQGQTRGYDASGAAQWTFDQAGGWQGSPAWASDFVFAGSQTSNDFYMLNDSDGSVALRVDGSGPAAFGQYSFFTVGTNGQLYAYSTRAHNVRVSGNMDSAISPAGDVRIPHGAGLVVTSGMDVFDIQVDGQPVGALNTYTLGAVLGDRQVHALAADFADNIIYTNNGTNMTFGPFLDNDNWNDPNALLGRINTMDHDDDFSWGWPPDTNSPMRQCFMAWQLWYKGSSDPADLGVKTPGSKNGLGMQHGAQVVMSFDGVVSNDMRNPYGIDFIVHGNVMFSTVEGIISNGADIGNFHVSGILDEPVTVSVAQSLDGPWYTYNNVFADAQFPTQPWKWDNTAKRWSVQEQDWRKPVDPLLTTGDFMGKSLVEAIDLYDGSAGGTGFDLEQSGFAWIKYIKFTDPDGRQGEITGMVNVPVYTGKYSLALSATNGSIDVVAGQYDSGTTLVLRATNAMHYYFTRWYGHTEGDVSNAVMQVVMNRDRTLSAQFLPYITTNGNVPWAWLADNNLTNATYPTFEAAADADNDSDGMSNREEFYAGTQPTNIASFFRILANWNEGGTNYVSWIGGTSGSALPFTVQVNTNLLSAWANVPGQVARSATGTNSWWTTNSYGSGASFRIVVQR